MEHEEDINEKNPFHIIIGIFLILLIILMIIPYYAVKLDPEPKPLNKINFVPKHIQPSQKSIWNVDKFNLTQDIRDFTLRVISSACPESKICYAKAIYYYVRDYINYVSDPKEKEYVQSPEETLLGGGDCEDKAVLVYYMMKSIGIKSRIVIIQGHAFNQILINEGPSKYHHWMSLDTTCKECDFGELSINTNYKKVLHIFG